jgi:hypothetical protein
MVAGLSPAGANIACIVFSSAQSERVLNVFGQNVNPITVSG